MEKVICKKCGCEEYETATMSNGNIKATCKRCKSYIKFLTKDEYPKIHFGKYKGIEVRKMSDVKYLRWMLEHAKNSKRTETAIRNRINELR